MSAPFGKYKKNFLPAFFLKKTNERTKIQLFAIWNGHWLTDGQWQRLLPPLLSPFYGFHGAMTPAP